MDKLFRVVLALIVYEACAKRLITIPSYLLESSSIETKKNLNRYTKTWRACILRYKRLKIKQRLCYLTKDESDEMLIIGVLLYRRGCITMISPADFDKVKEVSKRHE